MKKAGKPISDSDMLPEYQFKGGTRGRFAARGRDMIRVKIEAAFRRFMERDRALLEVTANERSVTHRFAVYIEEQFPEYHVDCEYNRKDMDPKRLRYFNRGVDSNDTNGVTVYPDIVVHRRLIASKNLLVIEAKLSSNREHCLQDASCTCDLCKLREYKRELGYAHAYFVLFPVGNSLGTFMEDHLTDYIEEVR